MLGPLNPSLCTATGKDGQQRHEAESHVGPACFSIRGQFVAALGQPVLFDFDSFSCFSAPRTLTSKRCCRVPGQRGSLLFEALGTAAYMAGSVLQAARLLQLYSATLDLVSTQYILGLFLVL